MYDYFEIVKLISKNNHRLNQGEESVITKAKTHISPSSVIFILHSKSLDFYAYNNRNFVLKFINAQ